MKVALSLALILLTANLLSLALVGVAAYLIHLNRPYWGWVLLAAVLCSHGPSGKADPTDLANPPITS